MEFITPADKKKVDAFAKKLGTFIPGTCSLFLWPLPIFEIMTEKIDSLERQVQSLQATLGQSKDRDPMSPHR